MWKSKSDRSGGGNSLLAQRVLRSRPLSYFITSLFNFVVLTLLILVALRFFSPTVATVVTHSFGVILSMIFTLDVWWARVSRQIALPVSLRDRGIFLFFAVITGALSAIAVGVFSGNRADTFAVLLNWASLFVVSVLKFFLLDRAVSPSAKT